MSKPILSLEFKDVIWIGPREIASGFFDWAGEVGKTFDLVLFDPTQSLTAEGRNSMGIWLNIQHSIWREAGNVHKGAGFDLRVVAALPPDVALIIDKEFIDRNGPLNTIDPAKFVSTVGEV